MTGFFRVRKPLLSVFRSLFFSLSFFISLSPSFHIFARPLPLLFFFPSRIASFPSSLSKTLTPRAQAEKHAEPGTFRQSYREESARRARLLAVAAE